MSETEYQIIEDCPHFIYGCCQKYLNGDCSAHKCDLKIIRELQQKLQAKEQECKELKEELKINQNFVRDGSIESTALCKILENYKQALNEVKKILDNGTADTQTNNAKWIHQWYLARFCEIREIINRAKEQ